MPASTARTASGSGVAASLGARRAAQQQPRLADLGAVEEPLAAAQHVRHPHVGERLLVHLGLRVDPEQHGDLGRGRAGVDEPAALGRHAAASANSSDCGGGGARVGRVNKLTVGDVGSMMTSSVRSSSSVKIAS